MKKAMVLLIVGLQLILTFPVQPAETRETKLNQLSQLLKKGSAPNVKLPMTEKKKVEELLNIILPGTNYIGEDKEWKIVYHDIDEGDFFQVDLQKKGDQSFDKFIWFHILYKQKKPEFYGSEDFEGYKGMGMQDMHYFLLVGNVEIRAVASSEEFKNDKKIKDMLRAFKLKDIEQL